jgi:hypothetical protein
MWKSRRFIRCSSAAGRAGSSSSPKCGEEKVVYYGATRGSAPTAGSRSRISGLISKVKKQSHRKKTVKRSHTGVGNSGLLGSPSPVVRVDPGGDPNPGLNTDQGAKSADVACHSEITGPNTCEKHYLTCR